MANGDVHEYINISRTDTSKLETCVTLQIYGMWIRF